MMKRLLLLSYYLVLSGLIPNTAHAQMPTDALMMEKGQICTAVLFTHDTWDEYWEGALKRNNLNIGTLTRQTVMPMFALGIVNRINLMAALPWVRTEPSAGQMVGAQGIQDWGLWVKGEVLKLKTGPGNFTLHTTLGLTGPASGYLADYLPFSIGLGCLEGSLRGILQYELDKGPYLRAQGGYHLRGNTTIERDYYYAGQGYYTDEVDMPNVVMYEAALGSWFLNKALRVEARFDGMNTQGGADIRRQDMPFPSYKMVFTRVGGFAQYYLPFVKGLGVIVAGNHILSGRNIGQSTTFTGGITYQFGIWK